MSRAGEGKNESSAGRRVIVAKGSGEQRRAGQGRAGQKGAMPLAVDIGGLQLGGRYHGNMWAMPMRSNQGVLSLARSRGARRERCCCANIRASGRAEVIGGGGLEEGRVMRREQLLPDTPVVGWALSLMYVRQSLETR